MGAGVKSPRSRIEDITYGVIVSVLQERHTQQLGHACLFIPRYRAVQTMRQAIDIAAAECIKHTYDSGGA